MKKKVLDDIPALFKKKDPGYLFVMNITYLLLLLTFGSCKNEVSVNQVRPNILFIMSDDHTSQAWGIYVGILENHVKNKHIKRLAREGTVLDNAFCTNSICTPSRAAILTGKYSHQNGIYTLSESLEPDSFHIAKLLQKHDYQTAIIGKWHLKKKPAGFDYYNVLPGQGRYQNPILKTASNWEAGGQEYSGFSADVIGDLSIDWLKSREEGKPFFLMTHFKATHEPFDYPQRYRDLYENMQIPEPPTLLDFQPSSNSRTFTGQTMDILQGRYEKAAQLKSSGKYSRYPGPPVQTEGLDSIAGRKETYQKFIKDFMRSGAAIDDNIGKLLAFLDANKLTENTIIIYTADQGYFLGEHGFFDKRMIYEEALRMPFVIRYPKEIPAGKRNKDIILNIDFPSLIADYAQLTPPSSFQGKSFRNNLTGKTAENWRNSMYYRYWLHQSNRPAHFGIRTDRYKLAFFYGQPLAKPGAHKETTPPAWEFYDLSGDPYENSNSYHNPDYTSIINELKEELKEWRKKLNDTDKDDPVMQNILENNWDQ